MPNLTIKLAETFLENFNYCDVKTGKRHIYSNWDKFKSHFFNHELTDQLEKLANATTTQMQSILSICKNNNCEKIDSIIALINETINKPSCVHGHPRH